MDSNANVTNTDGITVMITSIIITITVGVGRCGFLEVRRCLHSRSVGFFCLDPFRLSNHPSVKQKTIIIQEFLLYINFER